MHNISSQLHFPADIKLKERPLAEVWLEMRWQLQPIKPPHVMVDPNFAFALGAFYHSVRDRFGYRKDLDASRAPVDMLPYVVRHQFRHKEGSWPLLQIGPGVATVNFVSPYTWADFRTEALYLRSKLMDAYGESDIKSEIIALRYRNVEPFEYQTHNLLDFLRDNLNTSLTLPDYIPGLAGSKQPPSGTSIQLTFDLAVPKGTGTILIASGLHKSETPDSRNVIEKQVIVWQLEVVSGGVDAPSYSNVDAFCEWLDSAHATIHEWFFALIEGPLYTKYSGET